MSARLFLFGALLLTSGCGPSPTPPPTRPERPSLNEPNAKIRAEFLSHTPPGTSVANVLAFIAKALPPTPGIASATLEPKPASSPSALASGHAGTQRVRIVLGEYLPNAALLLEPIPLAVKERVTVQWAFDAEGRLLDLFVDKTAQFGD